MKKYFKHVLVCILALSMFAAACGQDYDEYASAGNGEVVAVINTGARGQSKGVETILYPDSDPYKIAEANDNDKRANDKVETSIPTSDRFFQNSFDVIAYEQSLAQGKAPVFIPTGDAGARPYYSARSSDGFEMIVPTKAEFMFNIAGIPEFIDQHLIRNTEDGHWACPPGFAGNPSAEDCQWYGQYDMGFNADETLVSAWIEFLIRKFEPQLDAAVRNVTGQYTRSHLYYDWPVCADAETGEVPEDYDPSTCPRTSDQYNEKLSVEFTRLLRDNLGKAETDADSRYGAGSFHLFCAVGHNQATPTDCDEIIVRIHGQIFAEDVTFAERARAAQETESQLANDVKIAANAERAAQQTADAEERLAGINQTAALEAANRAAADEAALRQIENDRAQAALEAQNNAEAAIYEEEQAAAERAKTERLAELERQAEIDKAEADKAIADAEERAAIAEIRAQEAIAQCLALGITDGFECRFLLTGEAPPQVITTNDRNGGTTLEVVPSN